MDARELPTYEPREIAAGETPRWRKSLDDFPASDGWALTYYLRGPGTGFDVTATADGDDYLVEVPLASTQNLQPGTYTLQGWVSKDSERYQVCEKPVTVKQGFTSVTTATTVDNRSKVKKTLDAIDARIEGRVTADIHMYMIGNRQLMKIPMNDLLNLRKYYAGLYAGERRRERVRRGGTLFSTIKVRFDEPK